MRNEPPEVAQVRAALTDGPQARMMDAESDMQPRTDNPAESAPDRQKECSQMTFTATADRRRQMRFATTRAQRSDATYCRTNGCTTRMLPFGAGQLRCPICLLVVRTKQG